MIGRNHPTGTALSAFFLVAILAVQPAFAHGTYVPSWQAPIGIGGMAIPPGYPNTFGTPKVTRGSYYRGEARRREQLSRQMFLNDPSSFGYHWRQSRQIVWCFVRGKSGQSRRVMQELRLLIH